MCVDPDQLDKVWPHVSSFIQMAFWSGRGDDNADIIYEDLKKRTSLLWVVWDDDDKIIIAAGTTKLFNVPRGRVCVITSCAGNRLDQWIKFFYKIEEYARAEGCKYVRLTGRRGWRHYFPNWSEPWITLEKEL